MTTTNNPSSPKSVTIAIAVLVILHLVGLIGTVYVNEALMKLTPVNLLVNLGVVLWMHKGSYRNLAIYAAIVFVCGFLLEWAGVHTGVIFGQYFYGNNLGYQVAEVPLIIGVNWLLLSYGSMQTVSLFSPRIPASLHKWLLPLAGALIMVGIDVWIEQLCQRLDFWYWRGNEVPLQNYTAWFFFSFAFNFLFTQLGIATGNRVAVWLTVLQLAFFVALNLLLV